MLFILIICIIVQVTAPLITLEFQEPAQHKGHFALYNCFVLGHTKYNGVQRVYCNPFPAKPYHSSHHLDIVMIRPPGIDNGAFVVSPDTVWYARVLHLPWLTLEPSPLNAHLYQRWKHMTILRMVIIISILCITSIICVILIYAFQAGWLEFIGSRVLYELDYKKPILWLKVSWENCL